MTDGEKTFEQKLQDVQEIITHIEEGKLSLADAMRQFEDGMKTLSALDEELKDKTLAAADYVDRHCEFIALVFGVTVDEVLDNLDLEEVLPLYNEVVKEIVATLYKGFGEVKKNEAAEAT